MLTQRRNSAIFREVSGPNCCPYPWNASNVMFGLGNAGAPMASLYADGSCSAGACWPGSDCAKAQGGLGTYQNPVPGGNYSDQTGLASHPGFYLRPGQVGSLVVLPVQGNLRDRAALEAELESRGIWTRELFIRADGTQATWVVGPRDSVVTSDYLVKQIMSVIAKVAGIRAFVYMPAPPEWVSSRNTVAQGDWLAGLGGWLFGLGGLGATCAENAACATAAECPAGTQWIATRSVPEGGMCVTPEAYANFTGATVAANLNRPWTTRYVRAPAPPTFWEEHQTAILVTGGIAAVGITALAVLAFRKKNARRRKRNRRQRRLRGAL